MTEMTLDTTASNEVRTTELGADVQTSDSSTETHAENKAQVSDNAQKRINELTAEKYALKQQLAEQNKQKTEVQSEAPVNVAPTLPDDLFDEDAMKQYHKDMVSFSQKSAEQAAQSTYEKINTKKQQDKQQVEASKTIESFAKQGLQDGLTIDKMRTNEQILIGAGVGPELGNYLLQDPNGAKVMDYLANNPEDMQKAVSMNPMQAAVFIASEVKLKAMGPSNVSNAPEPTDILTSGGGNIQKDEFDDKCPGAQFD